MPVREAVIVDVVRTALGKRKGALSGWHPTDLLGFTLGHLVDRVGVDPELLDDVVCGCVTQSGEQGCNVARNAVVAGGLPWTLPATTVDRQCGSSQQAMHFVAASVISGMYDIAIACGVESMSRAPMASNARGGTGPFSPTFMGNIDDRLWAQFRVAQVLADEAGVGRDEMDAYALESHRRAAEATRSGHFAAEIVPVQASRPIRCCRRTKASATTPARPRSPRSPRPSRGSRTRPGTSPPGTRHR